VATAVDRAYMEIPEVMDEIDSNPGSPLSAAAAEQLKALFS
jgi:hypothetical protein